MKAINCCPVSTLQETDELMIINEDSQDDCTLSGFWFCGTCVKVCM